MESVAKGANAVRPKLEVCVDTAAGLCAAVAAGADRIELCSALALSGLTPSQGLMKLAKSLDCTVYVMIRPRAGDFVYDAQELDLMRRDIDAVWGAGLDGVVLGASLANGALDEAALAVLLDQSDGLGTTLHRAFDVTPDQAAALETAIDMGFERVLTSGGAASAPAGADRIAERVRQAAGRITIMAGSGVTAANAPDLVRRTGVREVHASCSAPAALSPASPEAITERLDLILGRDATRLRLTQSALVSDLVAALDGL
jgi:copper homeostasis protein